jgi:hypothetical protein
MVLPAVKSEAGTAPVSVIIPIGPGESGPFALLSALVLLPPKWEVIFALCEPRDDLAVYCNKRVYTVISSAGRAVQMNTAAQASQGEVLWFLHLDSILTIDMISALQRGLKSAPAALQYFRLAFDQDGAGPTRLNAWAANLRSRRLGVPFGDQGLCLSAQHFHALGGYPENVSYGEDHLLVWHARQRGIRLNELDATLCTSARKYRARGWFRLTAVYQWRWMSQALPQYIRLLGCQWARRRTVKSAP